jgi:hypothetical protein
MHASKDSKTSRRQGPRIDSRRRKGESHHSRKGSSAKAIAQRSGARLEANRRQGARPEKPGYAEVLSCWLCGGAYANCKVIVARDVPGGIETSPHPVHVHLGCWMDMDD